MPTYWTENSKQRSLCRRLWRMLLTSNITASGIILQAIWICSTTRFWNGNSAILLTISSLWSQQSAFWKEKRAPNTQVLLHSDQGVQYSSAGYCNLLKEYNVIQSMSRAGNPRDNAVMESFWGRFKDTLRKHFRYWERDDLRSTIEQAIYYFNNERPVRKLKGKPPVPYRTELVA